MSKTVDFYFDFSSPNAYLGYVQLDRLQSEQDFTIRFKPVFLGGIMKELGTTPPAMQNEKKGNYLSLDIKRWSEFYDIPFQFPSDFPVDSLRAMRGYLALESMNEARPRLYMENVFRAAWAEDRDISEPEVLESCLSDSTEVSRFNSLIEDESIKDEFKERTDRALDRGVFGCPTFFVDDEPFWGKDRMQFIEDRLARS